MSSSTAAGGQNQFAPVPPDDLDRHLTVAQPDDPNLAHVSVVGDTYTVLVSGADTGGRYALIDIYVTPGGGPPPHRHDFEEMFTLLDGQLDVTFRGSERIARAGETINVPANAPHHFRNSSGRPARLLCLCVPAGLEEFFAAIGEPVASRTASPPGPDAGNRAARLTKARELAPRYRTELLVQ